MLLQIQPDERPRKRSRDPVCSFIALLTSFSVLEEIKSAAAASFLLTTARMDCLKCTGSRLVFISSSIKKKT